MNIPEPRFELKGPDAIRQRVEELRARMGISQRKNDFQKTLESAQKAPQPLSGELSGAIGGDPNDLRPLDPLGPNFALVGTKMSKVEIQSLIAKVAKEQNVDERLINAVVQAESDYNPMEVSHAGAQGLMQLMPETAKSVGVRNPFDPYENLTGGTKYLKQMINRYEGNLEIALAAYNAGPGNVDKAGGVPNFAETKRYVNKILTRLNQRP